MTRVKLLCCDCGKELRRPNKTGRCLTCTNSSPIVRAERAARAKAIWASGRVLGHTHDIPEHLRADYKNLTRSKRFSKIEARKLLGIIND